MLAVTNLAVVPPPSVNGGGGDSTTTMLAHARRLLDINPEIQSAFTRTYRTFGWGGDGGGSGAGSSVHFTVGAAARVLVESSLPHSA
jgi:hypothetical protein